MTLDVGFIKKESALAVLVIIAKIRSLNSNCTYKNT